MTKPDHEPLGAWLSQDELYELQLTYDPVPEKLPQDEIDMLNTAFKADNDKRNNVVEITPWRKNYPAEDEMVKAVKDVVYSFANRVSIATTFGVLEIITNDLRKELL